MGMYRVVRGGSWNSASVNCRSAYRNQNVPDNRNNDIGFRLVFVPQLISFAGWLLLNRCKTLSLVVRRANTIVTPGAGRAYWIIASKAPGVFSSNQPCDSVPLHLNTPSKSSSPMMPCAPRRGRRKSWHRAPPGKTRPAACHR